MKYFRRRRRRRREAELTVSHHHVGHLLPDGGVPGSSLVLDGLPVHAHLETPPEPTAPTLVTVGLVYHTALPLPTLAPVLSAPSDGPLEEPRTPVTREDPVVLPGREIPAHLAGNIVQDTTTGTAGVLRAESILLQKIFHRKKYFKPFKPLLTTVKAQACAGETL